MIPLRDYFEGTFLGWLPEEIMRVLFKDCPQCDICGAPLNGHIAYTNFMEKYVCDICWNKKRDQSLWFLFN